MSLLQHLEKQRLKRAADGDVPHFKRRRVNQIPISEPLERCTVCFSDVYIEQPFCECYRCYHKVHAECLLEWLKESRRCPICAIDYASV